jgi:hypothetical protein
MTEFAGTLRERIVIENPVSLRNAMGLQEPGWERVCSCLAAVSLESVGAEAEAQAYRPIDRIDRGDREHPRLSWNRACRRPLSPSRPLFA